VNAPDETIPIRIASIGEKVAPRCRQLRLGPTLTEDDVARFEQRHGITLPDDFAAFLREIGNGASGPPGFGLLPLGTAAGLGDDERYWTELPDIAKPFPFTAASVWEGEDASDRAAASARHGALLLGNDGCGMLWLLIVTGTERGRVWWLTDVGVQPTMPRRDFLRWFVDWLDGTREWF
jgi:hypothetical protein